MRSMAEAVVGRERERGESCWLRGIGGIGAQLYSGKPDIKRCWRKGARAVVRKTTARILDIAWCCRG